MILAHKKYHNGSTIIQKYHIDTLLYFFFHMNDKVYVKAILSQFIELEIIKERTVFLKYLKIQI